ncbi:MULTISPECIES: hypothetical protein [unclassified Brevundimonas]|uniref:hypothetical protein n=1 Tax=unclassified Brevundimonas TaxID=2622653 RepID=UPI000CFAE640|nr:MULTISPECIES: hypothetical protein [unclassified Brevundimonas]PQZ78635.1 hypothetical protein CQ026_12145 [Brevundimonas sp. MYb31]PRB13587.1 hypothetical protein CQ039_12390 [Brevundimonas sp. MYb52]PRB34197.1 hypothetical protein CQ035_11095 [Brevundimonas sp. MYb46]PRB46591.1 hypothetical protein CQ028_11225 [Brevundimonas sp. MYb33]
MPITTTRLVAPVAVLAALPLLVWCQRPPEPTSAPAPAPAPSPTVVLDSNLNRFAVLAALSEAGSALADGQTREAALNGRTVSVRLPFGCGGETSSAEGAAVAGLPRLVRNSDGGLTLTVTPEDLKARIAAGGVAPAAETSLDQWDAIEGFWIARPWSGLDSCPAPAAVETAPPEAAKVETDKAKPAKTPAPDAPPPPVVHLPERTAGLAAVVEADGSRLGRRQGQAYAHVIRGEKGTAPTPAPGGYALRLEGRLTTFADGKAVKCVQRDVESRPVCVAALRLDRLAFEDGATGALLSEWRPR